MSELHENLRVELFDVERLIPDPDNVRLHDNDNHNAIRRSIKRFGIRKPIVAHEGTKIVYAGNETLACAIELGYKEIPVAWIPNGTSESVAKAYGVADNATNDLSEFDEPALLSLITELKDIDSDFDTADIGFSSDALNELMDSLVEDAEIEEDAFEAETEAEPVSQLGDIWVLGEHRLICGDSLDRKVISRLMQGVEAVMIATDPPYGVDLQEQKYNPRAKAWDDIVGDKRQGEELQEWLTAGISLWLDFISDDAVCYFWSAAKQEAWSLLAAAAAAGLHVQGQIIWVKNQFVLGRADYHWQHENCWYCYRKNSVRHRWFGGRTQSTVWEVSKVPHSQYEHPTQKPIELFAIPLKNHTRECELVFEPFSGSGTQLIVCEQLNRRCYAVEIDPRYIDVAVKRYVRYTEGLKECYVERDGQKITYDDLFGVVDGN